MMESKVKPRKEIVPLDSIFKSQVDKERKFPAGHQDGFTDYVFFLLVWSGEPIFNCHMDVPKKHFFFLQNIMGHP
jgi:hypothetical protein